MTEEEKKTISLIMEKSLRSLLAANGHLDKKDFDFAASKAYYAVFHAIQAILLTKDLAFSKHSAVIAAFNQDFVKTGIFQKEMSRKIERLFKERQIGDYEYENEISEKDAIEDVNIAKEIVGEIKKYLTGKGVL
jgi:uncharacterized protein (UPF0332 family)